MEPLERLHATNARRAVTLGVVALLLLAACGRGGNEDDPAAGRATPTPTPTAEPIQVGGEDDDTEDGADGVTDGGEAPDVAAPDPEDPADTLRALFEAIEAEDYTTQAALTGDGMRTLMRIRDIIRQENARRGATTTNDVTVHEAAVLASRDGDEATVSVRANIRSTVEGDKGTLPSDATVDGPVTLRRTEGVWRVTDLVYSGRRLGEGYMPVDARQTHNDVRLEVPAFLSYKETTATLMRFVNEVEGGVPLHIRRAVVVDTDGTEHSPTQLAIEGRDTPTIFVGFDRLDVRPASLRVEVRNEETGRNWSYTFQF